MKRLTLAFTYLFKEFRKTFIFFIVHNIIIFFGVGSFLMHLMDIGAKELSDASFFEPKQLFFYALLILISLPFISKPK
jgi:hypothetical protein